MSIDELDALRPTQGMEVVVAANIEELPAARARRGKSAEEDLEIIDQELRAVEKAIDGTKFPGYDRNRGLHYLCESGVGKDGMEVTYQFSDGVLDEVIVEVKTEAQARALGEEVMGIAPNHGDKWLVAKRSKAEGRSPNLTAWIYKNRYIVADQSVLK